MTNDELDSLRADIMNTKFHGCKNCMALQQRVEANIRDLNAEVERLREERKTAWDALAKAQETIRQLRDGRGPR